MATQGSPVKPGDVIIRFDDSSAKRQLQEKEASLRQAQASLDQAMAEGGAKGGKKPLFSFTQEVKVWRVEPVRDSQFVPPANFKRSNPR